MAEIYDRLQKPPTCQKRPNELIIWKQVGGHVEMFSVAAKLRITTATYHVRVRSLRNTPESPRRRLEQKNWMKLERYERERRVSERELRKTVTTETPFTNSYLGDAHITDGGYLQRITIAARRPMFYR